MRKNPNEKLAASGSRRRFTVHDNAQCLFCVQPQAPTVVSEGEFSAS